MPDDYESTDPASAAHLAREDAYDAAPPDHDEPTAADIADVPPDTAESVQADADDWTEHKRPLTPEEALQEADVAALRKDNAPSPIRSHLLGVELEAGAYNPLRSVLSVPLETSHAGNIILRVGREVIRPAARTRRAWESTEYVVLTPDERDDLIAALEATR